MKIITLLSFTLFGIVSFAQNCSLTIFNNNGQQFFVIMNGIKQNSLPQTNVKIGGMSTGSYEVKLIFADGKTGDINKKIYFSETGDYLARVVFKGKKRKLQYFGVENGSQTIPAGGSTVIYRPNDQSGYSDQSLNVSGTQNGVLSNNGSTSTTTSGSSTVMPSTATNGTTNNGMSTTNGNNSFGTSGNVNTNSSSTNTNTSTNVSVPTSTTTTINSTPNGGLSGANITNGTIGGGTTTSNDLGGFGINVNINVSDPTMGGNGSIGTSTTVSDPSNGGNFGMNTSVSGNGLGNGTTNATSTSTSTTSTTNSSTTIQNGQVINDSYNHQQTTTVTQNGQTTTTTQSTQGVNGGMGQVTINSNQNGTMSQPAGTVNTGITKPVGTYSCTKILVDGDAFAKQVENETFDGDKRTLIETGLNEYCLTTDQAFKILGKLRFDSDQLDLSKYLYVRLTDKVNGVKLLELLSFDTDKEDLKEFMRSH